MKCAICKKRKANVWFTDSTMSYIHGFSSWICRPCFIEIIEKHIKDCQKQLKEQRKLDTEERIRIASKAIREIRADPKEMKKLDKMYYEQTGKKLK